MGGDGNCFYRAVALLKDEDSNEKYVEISRSSESLLEKKLKVFKLTLSSTNSLEDLVRKSNFTGTPAETMDIYIQICIAPFATHLYLMTYRRRRKGSVLSRLSALIRSH